MNNKVIDYLIATKAMEWEDNGTPFYGINGERVASKEYFQPSDNIKDAWKVVEKFYISVCPQKGAPKEMSYHAEIDNQPMGNYYESFDETAPMAICKVALKSLGVII